MKKKILAVLMGLTLAFTPACVFAEEETEAADAIIVNAAESSEELSGRIEIIYSDGRIVISLGEWSEDEEDNETATLWLTGWVYELAFAEDSVGIRLSEQKVITVEEVTEEDEEDTEDASIDGETEETISEETKETEETAEEKTNSEESSEDESEMESDSETDAEATLDAEEITIDDLQVGDIITFTVDDDYSINSYVLIGTESL